MSMWVSEYINASEGLSKTSFCWKRTHGSALISRNGYQTRNKEEVIIVNFVYYCYRCGAENNLDLPAPDAPEYHHADIKCSSCGDGTRVLLSSCPNDACGRYVYWIDDMSIPDLVQGFAKYMVHNMQALIDQAATQGVNLEIDTPNKYPINASCPCGTTFSVEIDIPDLD
jgi:DNA-directed RNA polymerase subunit RPC12/RpoP